MKANRTAGFTLPELLVVVVLAGGILAGALHLAVHLMTVNQQQMARSRLNSDLQRSLNYMVADLEQAVHVYSGDCLGRGERGGCPGLANHLPTTLTPEQGRYPVLAFWRRSPLSAALLQRCRQGRLPVATCQAQHSYTLVVYLVSTRDGGGIWQGQGRLQR
ncbi:MAG: prepilin-type N-terminal cleavage/methylation domain-containing protein, partial [Cyanobacteria bacterium P01_A01_bin.135]